MPVMPKTTVQGNRRPLSLLDTVLNILQCSGSYPCVRCAEEKQECIFDGRKSAYQRNQDLRSREKALSKVFDILRSLNGSSSITTIQQLARQTSNIQSFTDSVTELDDSDNIGSSGEGSSARTASKRSPNIKDEGSQYEEDSLMKNLRSSFSESRSRVSSPLLIPCKHISCHCPKVWC